MPSGVQHIDRTPGVHTITCHTCNQPKGPEGQTLKKCARCSNIWYCTRACQRANWNDHKKYCRKGVPVGPRESARLEELLRMACAQQGFGLEEVDEYGGNDPAMAGPSNAEMEAMGWNAGNGWGARMGGESGGESGGANVPDVSIPAVAEPTPRQREWSANAWDEPGPPSLARFADFRPSTVDVSSFVASLPGQYLHEISEAEVFRMLIDTFVCYKGDEWLRGNLMACFVREDPLPFFKGFLDRAEAKTGILSSWWCAEKRAELENANDTVDRLMSRSDGAGIPKRYGDPELRVLAEKIGLAGLIEGLTKHLEPPHVPTVGDFMRGMRAPTSTARGDSDITSSEADSMLSRPSTVEYLHSISEFEALGMLSDAYKLHMWGERYSHWRSEPGDNPQSGFEKFLDRAAASPGILPTWWNAEKRTDCQRMNEGFTQPVLCFEVAVGQKYKDKTMATKLRALAKMILSSEI